MKGRSKLHCIACGYKLKLEGNYFPRKDVPYRCPYCHTKWLLTISPKNSTYFFVRIKDFD